MFRVRLIFASAAIAMSPALAGCSGSSLSSYVPDWLSFKPAPPPAQALQFESAPPGASVRTTQGETCRTPCSLALPVAAQAVTFELNGFIAQTVPIQVSESNDLVPNPVQVALQPIQPVKPPPKPHRKPPPKTARRVPPPPPPPGAAPPPPPAQDTLGDRFPPPSQQQPAPSPFPPPPPSR